MAVDHYFYGVSTSGVCATRDVLPDIGPLDSNSNNSNSNGLTLTLGTTYYNCVDAYDAAGNHSGFVASDGILMVPTSHPTAGTIFDFAAAIAHDVQTSTEELAGFWSSTFSDDVGIDHYV